MGNAGLVDGVSVEAREKMQRFGCKKLRYRALRSVYVK